ncbi:MAG: PIN domain-containing protein [bacterium]
MPILADTGPLYALADISDAHHKAARAVWEREEEIFIVPVTILPEVCYLLTKYLGAKAELRFLGSLAGGEMKLESLTEEDLERSMEILEKYRDADFGFVDASLMAISERLKIKKVFTLDKKHFRTYKPSHCASLTLLP